jgi:hypothetical protein
LSSRAAVKSHLTSGLRRVLLDVVEEWKIQRFAVKEQSVPSYPNVDDPNGWQLEMAQSRSEALGFLRECRRVLTSTGTVPDVVLGVDR